MTTHYQTALLLPCLLCCSLAAMDSPTAIEMPRSRGEAAASFTEQHKFLENLISTMENFDSKPAVYRYFLKKRFENKLYKMLTALPQTQIPFFAYIKIFLEDRAGRYNSQPPLLFRAPAYEVLTPTGKKLLARSTAAQLSAREMDVKLVKKLFEAIDRMHDTGKATPFAAIQYGTNRFITLLNIARESPIFRCDRDIEDMTQAAGVMKKPLKLSSQEATQMKIMTDQLSGKLAEYEAPPKNQPSR